MKIRLLNVVAFIMYLLCATATVGMLAPFFIDISYSYIEKFVICLFIFVLGFIGSKFRSMNVNIQKVESIMKKTLIWFFVVYTFIIVDFTLIRESFDKSISSIFLLDNERAREYIYENTNFVPFATIKLFLNAYKDGNLEPYRVVENIVGNFFVFMPFALFVPNIFTKINNTFRFSVFIASFVIIIEVLQIVFLSGSADIDDLILTRAAQMIVEEQFSLNAISNRFGFCDQFYFSRKFKAKFGVTPSEYKRQRDI